MKLFWKYYRGFFNKVILLLFCAFAIWKLKVLLIPLNILETKTLYWASISANDLLVLSLAKHYSIQLLYIMHILCFQGRNKIYTETVVEAEDRSVLWENIRKVWRVLMCIFILKAVGNNGNYIRCKSGLVWYYPVIVTRCLSNNTSNAVLDKLKTRPIVYTHCILDILFTMNIPR